MTDATDRPVAFTLPVEGVGVFTFAKRTMRAHLAVEVEYSRLTEGVETITKFCGDVASAMADLKVLTVSAPKGWDVEELDAADDESFNLLMKVWSAFREREVTFRKGAQAPGAGAGPRAGAEPGVLVSA
jgi:hypothetical protein